MRLRTLLVLAVAVVAPLAARAQNISTVAGGGPINLPKSSASIGAPAAVRQDSLGNTYILDNNFNRVYKVDHLTGNMTVYAGNGADGFAGDGALAVDAELSGPSGMCMDASNNLFIADSDNAVVRVVPATTMNLVNPVRTLTAGNIYTFAGTPMRTNFVYGGDGGPATSAFLHFPDGCGVDSVGNVYIADKDNNAIRVVSATTGNISLFAGSSGAVPPAPPALGFSGEGGPAVGAALDAPWDVFVDSSNNIFIADTGNNVIREVPFATSITPPMTAGHIYTVAGAHNVVGSYNGQNIAAITARLNGPKGLFVDAAGDIFFADQVNQVIREVPVAPTPLGMIAGDIYDVAGTAGSRGYSGDTGKAIAATLSSPAGTFVSTGSIFIADSSSDAIRQVASNTLDYTTELISTFAGNGHLSYGGDGLPATHGELNVPAGIFVDNAGNLAIADAGTPVLTNSLIRGVAAPISTGNLATLAGRPEFNGFVDGVPASTSVVNNAIGVFVDPSLNTFIADTDNCIVRKITGTTIATIAGTNPTVPDPLNPLITTPVCGFSAQGGVATSTILGAVNGVAVDGSGNVFFSDVTNNVIWEVPKATAGSMTAGHAYIVAGTQQLVGSFGGEGGPAAAAQLNSPTGIFIDIFGNLFIADTKNNLIREVPADNTTNPSPMTAGHIYTVAGAQGQPAGFSGDGAAATSAQLNNPFTMVADHAGNIFIADTNNQVIREVSAANGNINTVAGTHGSAGFSGDGAAATLAQLSNPEGLAIDGASGDLLVGDSTNNRVRSIAGIANVTAVPVASFDQTSLTFAIQLLNTPSAAQVVKLTNTGTSALTITGITITGANSGDFAQTNTCPGSLAAAANCTISVKFTPTAVGARTASVRIADSATGSPQTISLTGTGGLPTATLGGTTLTFTNQLVTTPSATQPITLTNNGNMALSISGITITGANSADFGQTNTCGASLAATLNCTITVTFTPTAAGTRTAAVSIADNLVGSPQTVSLTGTGVAPIAGLSGNSLTFTAQTLNTTSAAQTVTLTNTGTSALTITGITITGANSGDFAQTNTCGASLAISANCTISVTFTPTANGPRIASVSIADSASGSPQAVSLTGTGGTPAASFTPATTLNFSNQQLGKPSTAQSVTLTNSGTVPLAISGITIAGTNAADFAQTNTCGASVAAGANCTISVTFTPSTLSSESAAVKVADNAAASPQAITLNGNGVAAGASLSPTSLAFVDQFVGTTSATAQTVTLTNNGSLPLAISGVAVTGANAGDYAQTNTCGTSVAATANCTITVNFTPTASGARPASITVTDNAPSGTQTVSLTGNGFTISLAAASGGSMSQTVKAGQTATYSLQLTTTGGSPTVAFSCSGAPSKATCNVPTAPVPVTAAAPVPVSITVSTTATAIFAPQSQPEMQPPAALRNLPLTLLALLLCIAAMLAWVQSPAGRMRTVRVALTACLVLLPISAATLLTGCASSGGSSVTPPPVPGTPAGSYTITVTMTVNGKAQATPLTLIVQ